MAEMPTLFQLMESQTETMKAIVQLSNVQMTMAQHIKKTESRVKMLEDLLLTNKEAE